MQAYIQDGMAAWMLYSSTKITIKILLLFSFPKRGVSLKEVVNTNKVLLHIEVIDGYIHISSVIDNLIKGAGGQAVENMNLMFGIEQTAGLKLKPSAF